MCSHLNFMRPIYTNIEFAIVFFSIPYRFICNVTYFYFVVVTFWLYLNLNYLTCFIQKFSFMQTVLSSLPHHINLENINYIDIKNQIYSYSKLIQYSNMSKNFSFNDVSLSFSLGYNSLILLYWASENGI